MEKSKLIKLYTALNSLEKEAFNKWLKSPLHNNDNNLRKLFEYISARRKLTTTALKKKKVYKAIFEDEEYDDLALRHLMEKGVKNLENFVGFWMSKKSHSISKLNLIEFLRVRQRPALAKQQMKQLEKSLKQTPHRNHQYFY